MKTLIGAALGALALVASPAAAQFYKAGTVTATPLPSQQDRKVKNQHDRPPAQAFYKPGVPGFMLSPPIKQADAPPPSAEASAADTALCACCDTPANPNPAALAGARRCRARSRAARAHRQSTKTLGERPCSVHGVRHLPI